MATNNCINNNNINQIVQQQYVTSDLSSSYTGGIRAADTPTTATSKLLNSITITPHNASNILVLSGTVPCYFSNFGVAQVGLFLYNGTSLLSTFVVACAAATSAEGNPIAGSFLHYVTAGTTSAITFNLYFAGPIKPAPSSTAYINYSGGTYPLWGDSSIYTFKIIEIGV